MRKLDGYLQRKLAQKRVGCRQTDSSPEVLHEHLRFLDLGGVHLRRHHRAEGHLRAAKTVPCI